MREKSMNKFYRWRAPAILAQTFQKTNTDFY